MEIDPEMSELTATDATPAKLHDPKLAKLTLEMFMNNNYYSKYLSTADPKAYREHQGFLDAIARHRSDILDMTRQLVDNPKLKITTPVLEAFQQYASTCIKYAEMRVLEQEAEAKDFLEHEREWSDAESNHSQLIDAEGARITDDLTTDDDDLEDAVEAAAAAATESEPFQKSVWGNGVTKRAPSLGEDLSGKKFWGDIRAFTGGRIRR